MPLIGQACDTDFGSSWSGLSSINPLCQQKTANTKLCRREYVRSAFQLRIHRHVGFQKT